MPTALRLQVWLRARAVAAAAKVTMQPASLSQSAYREGLRIPAEAGHPFQNDVGR